MEIKIRDLDDDVIARIDSLSREEGKSRNEFLKEKIRIIALAPELLRTENKYSILVEKICDVIQENTELLRAVSKELEREDDEQSS